MGVCSKKSSRNRGQSHRDSKTPSRPPLRFHLCRVSEALAEQVDIYPTLAALAGLPMPAHLQGVSLVPWLKDPATKSRIAVFSTMIATHTKALGHSARNGRFRYIQWNDGKDGEQIYDLQTDPQQLNNLAGQEAHLPMQRRLRSLLKKHLASVKAE